MITRMSDRATGLTARAAVAGLITVTGLTASRWATWEPYSPLLIPYDVLLVVGFTVLGWLFVGLAGVQRLVAMARRKAFALWLLVLPSGVALFNLVGLSSGRRLVIAGVTVLGAVLVVMSIRLYRISIDGITWTAYSAIVSAGLCVSLVGYSASPFWGLALPISIVLANLPGVPMGGTRPWFSGWFPVLICGALIGLFASTVSPFSRQRISTEMHARVAQDESVILIVIDTLRQDRLSVYGYDRSVTPNIEQWAQNGLVFEDATAASSWTLPSHASMFTGLYPRTHGAHGYRGKGERLMGSTTYALDPAYETLAEVLSEEGWETGAVVANHGFLARQFNLDQGFHTYWVPRPHSGVELPLSDWLALRMQPWQFMEFSWRYYRDHFVIDNAIRWLDAARSRPFFLFINLFDVHYPNQRPPGDVLPLEDETPIYEVYFPEIRDKNDFYPPLRYHKPAYSEEAMQLQVSEQQPLDPGVRRELSNNYDRELLHLDTELARLFDYLDKSGLSSSTHVVLTSDHGEYFGEHGLVFHSKHLHEEVVKIPMILTGPGITPGRSSKPVHSVDIFPTVLDLLNIPNSSAIQGYSILGPDTSTIVSEWYATTWPQMRGEGYKGRFDRSIRTVKRDNKKLFVFENGMHSLFDLVHDPDESVDVASDNPVTVQTLKNGLADWLAIYPSAAVDRGAVELSPENMERLRSLGYIQ